MALKPIEIILNAKDNASKVFDGLNAKMTAIAAAIAGYFGVNAFANVITGAGNFEEAMSRVQAATNTSGAELEKLKVAAEQAGATTKFTAIEAASALENLAKAGLNSEQAIAALPAVMNMAQAGGVSLADASERLTGVVMGMGLKFEDSARVADVLAMGANASRTSITGLAEAMSYAGPIAKTVGLSLEGTVAIIAQFANAGIDASRAGTALNSILAQFADPASKFRQELLGIGISTGNFETALKQLAAAGPKGAMAIQAVGLEAGPALRAALGLGIPALEELKGKLQGAEGSAAATAKVMGENLNGALKGLSSAWDTVKNALGTPVLPVLKSGVDELAGALRTAVENGTITKFGTALATAFQSAVEWARQFLATVDFGKVTTDMQAFASRAGEVFDQIGQYATNAGNVVKLMYGVMSAGTNTVMTAVYGIGEAFAGVARDIMSGVALIRDGLAKITFGGLSESFKLAAEDARLMAQGFGEASQAMHDKAVAAMDGIAAGAELANAGFTGLADAAAQTQTATDQGAQSLAAMSEAMRKEAEATYAAIEAADKKAEATNKATEATRVASVVAEESRARLAALRAEYDQTVALGNWQKAAELQAQINKTLKETSAASKDAAQAANAMAQAVGEAYQRLGVTSTETLKNLATQAKTDFETVKNSGTASAEDLSNAFAAAAEKAIAANKGLAPVWVRAEAALRGYRIETDAAGKQTLVSMKEAKTAIDGVTQAHGQASAAAVNHGMSVEELAAKYDDAGARAKAAAGQFLSADLAQQNADTAKSSITNRPASDNQYAWTRQSIVEWLEQAGLSKEDAKKLSADFVDSNGDVPYSNNPGQLKYGGKYSTLTDALYKAAYPYLFGDSGKQKGGAQDLSSGPTKVPKPPAPVPPPVTTPAPKPPEPAPAPTQPTAPRGWDGNGGSASITPAPTYVSNISLPGLGKATAKFDTPAEQQNMEAMLRVLTSAAGVAQ